MIANTNMRLGFVALTLAGLCAALAVDTAEAQRRSGFRLSAGEIQKAAALQVETVARQIGLNDETTKILEEAYITARKSYADNMPEREPGPGGFQAIREHNQAEAEKLESALSKILDEDQTKAAMATLGTFSRQWDRMALTVDGFDLDDEAKHTALGHIAGYVAEVDKEREEAMAGGDFQAIRQAMAAAKQKLDTKLAKELSEEQMKEWSEATTFRRGGGRRGPGN